MKNNNHFSKLPFCSAEQSNAQGACAAIQNKLQILFHVQARIFFKVCFGLTLFLTSTCKLDATASSVNSKDSIQLTEKVKVIASPDHLDSESLYRSAEKCALLFDFIVMEDDMLLINTGNPEDKVLKIEVFDASLNLVLVIEGCDLSQCQNSIAGLLDGLYYVTYSSTFGSKSEWEIKA